MPKKIIVITGASSGFGALAARGLADAGHTVYASMRETAGRNAPQVQSVEEYAKKNKVDLRATELDVSSEQSAENAIKTIVAEHGRLDVLIHNAGHMVFGPAEAFTPEQLAELYDINVLSTQRVNRAALPQLRKQRQGLVVWVSSSSSAGGTPPYLAPYFASKAGMDAMAVQYARELALWGIETSIVVPRRVHGRHEPFRAFRHASRQGARRRIRKRAVQRLRKEDSGGLCCDRSAGRGCRQGRRGHRCDRQRALRQAALPRACRSDTRRGGCRLYGHGPRAVGNAAPGRAC